MGHTQYSDVALLGDDYVVATHVWDAGMGILRDDGPQGPRCPCQALSFLIDVSDTATPRAIPVGRLILHD